MRIAGALSPPPVRWSRHVFFAAIVDALPKGSAAP
jgi:hypothetical protein